MEEYFIVSVIIKDDNPCSSLMCIIVSTLTYFRKYSLFQQKPVCSYLIKCVFVKKSNLMFLTLKLIFNFLCQICGVMFRALMFSESIQLWYKHCSSVSINYFSLVLIICSNNFTIQLVRKLVYNLWSLSCLFLSCVLGSLLLLSPQSFFP